ncbi:uncharacterized, partial [Tachysurus ichikawai]
MLLLVRFSSHGATCSSTRPGQVLTEDMISTCRSLDEGVRALQKLLTSLTLFVQLNPSQSEITSPSASIGLLLMSTQ